MHDLQLNHTHPMSRSTIAAIKQAVATRDVGLAQMRAQSELQVMKLKAITHVATEAMYKAASISSIEAALVQAVPQASGRVNLIAEMATLALAGVVHQTADALDTL